MELHDHPEQFYADVAVGTYMFSAKQSKSSKSLNIIFIFGIGMNINKPMFGPVVLESACDSFHSSSLLLILCR